MQRWLFGRLRAAVKVAPHAWQPPTRVSCTPRQPFSQPPDGILPNSTTPSKAPVGVLHSFPTLSKPPEGILHTIPLSSKYHSS
jgi:hypothetical protein